MHKFIPISQPSIGQLEIDYVTDAVKSTWISSLGKYIDRLEEEFAHFCQTKHAISLSNGTVAIQLALAANNIGIGDEVIVPDLSFIATANAVLHVGAKPVFIDIDPYNLCMDPNKIEAAITSKTKAIMPVHLYGHPADMEAINKVANKYGLIVIEDAAEAHGADINGKRVGGWGQSATFSFYGNKNITTGEGGMITTNDTTFAEKCKYLRDHAMSKEKRYWHTEPGYNFRMTNMQAALGCAQLNRYKELVEKKGQLFEWYNTGLKDLEGVSLNRTYEWATNSYWLIYFEHSNFKEDTRADFMTKMKAVGIDTRPCFYPMSDMPYFDQANTPATHLKYQQGLNLPTYFDLQKSDVDYIIENIKQILS